jgi:hypothetical protein
MRTALVLGMLVLVAPLARAVTLTSPALYEDPGSSVSCSIINASTKPLDVTVKILKDDRTVLTNYTFMAFAPGLANGVSVGGSGHGQLHCEVSYAGSSKYVRAALVVSDFPSGVVRNSLTLQ